MLYIYQILDAIKKALHMKPEFDSNNIGKWDLPGATPFKITDNWRTRLEARVRKR